MFVTLRKFFTKKYNLRQYYTVNSNKINKNNEEHQAKLYNQISAKIKMNGPITVAEYMREILTNPTAGYYMHRDVIGESGDFITSPELGQLFGEMVAVWFLNEWRKVGSVKPLNIIELGPGRGSLCQDILRVFKHFDELSDTSVHLVEVSPMLCNIQSRKLCLTSEAIKNEESPFYHRGTSASGVHIYWYKRIEDVPRNFSLIVAHEFFDALPIQKFQKTEKGWREVLIDIDEVNNNKFRYVLSNRETDSTKLLIRQNEIREHIEVSRDSVMIMKHLAERLEEDGGIALITDYGHNGEGTDTFRAFKQHKLHDPLCEPGSADLTADVDFSLLKYAAQEGNKTIAFGPVSQSSFLKAMGISVRVEQLLKHASPEEEKVLKFAVDMMMNDDKMGKRFKLLALFPEVLKNHLQKFPVIGFHGTNK